jgi:hypothetical protein
LISRLFVSEDVPIGHTQIIDTFDPSFCSIYSIDTNIYHSQTIPFDIVLAINETCTLNLYVIRLLDREQTPMYTVRRQLIEHYNLHTNDSILMQLSIVILDVNDHVPQFESEHFRLAIRENSSPGSLIGRVQAHDPDIFLNGKIVYSLFGQDSMPSGNGSMFRIDKDTGDLYLTDASLDYEMKREYTLMVEAKDCGDVEATLWPSVPSYADVIIVVDDVNDEKPEIRFTLPNDDQHNADFKMMNLSTSDLNHGESSMNMKVERQNQIESHHPLS